MAKELRSESPSTHDDPERHGSPVVHKSEKAKKLTLGVILVALIAVSQTGAAQFAKSTYVPGFVAPFFITWFNASWLIILYPVYYLCALFSCYRTHTMREVWKKSQSIFGPNGLTFRLWLTRGGMFSFLALGTNYSFVRALGIANPSDVTAVFASNSAFVFLLSCALLGAQIVSLKIISVCLAVAGIVLIAYSDGFSGQSSIGIVLSLMAAFGAALYIVLFKKTVKNATSDQVSLYLSVIASFSLLIFWPVILILHFSDMEVITENVPWTSVAGSCALSIVFNFLINYGTAYTYPLFIAFGGILSVPLNHAADWLFRSNVFDILKITGTLLIISAFILIVTLPTHIDVQFYHWVTTCAKKQHNRTSARTENESEQLNKTQTPLLSQTTKEEQL